MQFSKFAILFTSASAVLAAPLTLEADNGNSLAIRQATGGGYVDLALNTILGTLGLSQASLLSIINSVGSGLSAAQLAALAQVQAILSTATGLTEATRASLLLQVRQALAQVWSVPGTVQGTFASLSAPVRAAIAEAVKAVQGITIDVNTGAKIST